MKYYKAKVDIKPTNTYFCFGARFEMEGEENE